MGLDDKIKNKAAEVGGKGKERTGDATGDRDLQAEGLSRVGASTGSSRPSTDELLRRLPSARSGFTLR